MIHQAQRLDRVDPRLRSVIEAVGAKTDVLVLVGVREKEQQEECFLAGTTKIHFPDSKHNINPNAGREFAEAADLSPYPPPKAGEWESKETIARFYVLAGQIKQAALTFGIPIRQGWDWDGDGWIRDQSFNDLPHVELKHTQEA